MVGVIAMFPISTSRIPVRGQDIAFLPTPWISNIILNLLIFLPLFEKVFH